MTVFKLFNTKISHFLNVKNIVNIWLTESYTKSTVYYPKM